MQLTLPVFIGAIYGLLLRLLFGYAGDFMVVMSLSFLLLVPLGMGALTVRFSKFEKIYSLAYSFFAPWLSCLALLIMTLVFSVEGWVCWVMIFPIFAVFAGVGGLLMRAFLLRGKNAAEEYRDPDILDDGKDFRNGQNLPVSLLLVLPFLAAWLEQNLVFAPWTFQAETAIDIAAPAERIWAHVARVATIDKTENRSGLNHFLGLPRPLSAELDTLAVGGKREAIFEHGLVFHEKVYDYAPLRRMAFTIDADPQEIPATTMDEHIVIGGEFFDVLEGRYELEQLPDGACRLHLSSRFVLDTPFNWYAGWWARWIMTDIQENILQVIRARAIRETLN